jgi:hypothetical protein
LMHGVRKTEWRVLFFVIHSDVRSSHVHVPCLTATPMVMKGQNRKQNKKDDFIIETVIDIIIPYPHEVFLLQMMLER